MGTKRSRVIKGESNQNRLDNKYPVIRFDPGIIREAVNGIIYTASLEFIENPGTKRKSHNSSLK